MKNINQHSRILAAILSLFVLPLAFAGDSDKKMKKMDANDDGMVSRAEHTAGAQRMFTELDTNSDGVLTAAELSAKAEKHGENLSATERIKLLDQNADGQITAAEHAAVSAAKFDKLDTNSDGSLSKEELEAGIKAKKEKH